MEQLFAIAGTVLTVIITALAALATIRRERGADTRKFKLTFWGAILILLSAVVIVISIYNSLSEIEKKKSAELNAKKAQDSLRTSIQNINGLLTNFKNNFGIVYNINNKTSYIADTIRYRNKLVTSPKGSEDTTAQDYNGPITPAIQQTDELLPEFERIKKLNNNFDYGIARCKFINKTGVALKMYRGISTSSNSGVSKAILDIGNGKFALTDNIEVGLSQDKGPFNPPTMNFDFYFVTTNSSAGRRYGKINIKLTALKESTVILDRENLNLTASGPREESYLRDAGIN